MAPAPNHAYFAIGMSHLASTIRAAEQGLTKVGEAPANIDAALTWLQYCHRFDLSDSVLVSFSDVFNSFPSSLQGVERLAHASMLCQSVYLGDILCVLVIVAASSPYRLYLTAQATDHLRGTLIKSALAAWVAYSSTRVSVHLQ